MGRHKEILTRLRAKPDHVKRTIALVGTLVIFTGIASVWLTALNARMHQTVSETRAASPLSGIMNVLSGLSEDIKTSYSSASAYEQGTSTIATTTPTFDVNRVVVIDTASSTPVSTSSATTTLSTYH